jgi:peptidoglycan hydrolase-like protein with peptidoglycan-binding domain
MRFSPIAVAVAAALLSLSAVAQDKKPESQSGQPPMTQEQKPSTEAQAPAEKKEGTAAAGAPAEKKDSAAAGASAGGEAKGEAKGAAARGETKGAAAGQSPELIKQVQTKLKEQGHDVGMADGVLGPKTQKGLKDFQTSKGIKATGQLDQQTLSALGVSEAAAGGATKAEKAETKAKAEGSAAAGATAPEKKPETPAAPAKTETKPGEKKY